MPEKIAMTPDRSVEWEKHVLIQGTLYLPPEVEIEDLPAELMEKGISENLEFIGRGERGEDQGAAEVYRQDDFAIRIAKAGRFAHSDLAWLQANLMLAEALKECEEATEGPLKIITPEYYAMLMGLENMRTLMSYEGQDRFHPERLEVFRGFDKAKVAGEIAHRALQKRWGKEQPLRVDFKPTNLLVGEDDVVIVDADPLPGWGKFGI
jgi:hypothetical protein